jgi:membrane fusion protein (multidrug efflux system)
MKKKSPYFYPVTTALGLLVASLLAWWLQTPPASTKEISGKPRAASGAPWASVEVTRSKAIALQDDAQSVGTLRSRQSVVLRPEVAGRVQSLGFKDGAKVSKGQLLVQLDDTLQRAELQQTQAQLSIAQANFQRNQELVAQNFVSQRVLDESAAQLQVAHAQMALAQARLKRMSVLAPFAATAGLGQVSVGDYVRDGADLVALQDLGSMELDFRLPEQYQHKLKNGQSVELSVDALAGRRFKARIVAVDPLLDANGRSIALRAEVSNASGELRPGMFARVTVVFGTNAAAVVLPEQAIVPQGGKQYVIKVMPAVAKPDQPALPAGVEWVSQRHEVQLGLRKEGMVQIVQGLAPDQTIVLAGQQRLQRDGTPLRLLEVAR